MRKQKLITLLRSDCDHKRHSCAEVGCVMAKVIPEVERLYETEARLARVVEAHDKAEIGLDPAIEYMKDYGYSDGAKYGFAHHINVLIRYALALRAALAAGGQPEEKP